MVENDKKGKRVVTAPEYDNMFQEKVTNGGERVSTPWAEDSPIDVPAVPVMARDIESWEWQSSENEWISSNPWEIEEPIPTETPVVPTPVTPKKKASNGGTTTRELKNADVNFSQYWDDSSAPNQATAWWENEKYEWEGVKTSNVAYNPNATLDKLNPNYQYGMDAQRANTNSAWYIARRNDEIASALYNAWMTSKDDVINYLAQQKGWNNSTEMDRVNTVESIWKRLGQIVEQNPQSDEATPQWDNSPSEGGSVSTNDALNNMEADLWKSTAWELFGKVWPDEDGRVKTLEDENSVYKIMNEWRIQNFKSLQGMDSQAIAAAIVWWAMSSDNQAMRDLMQYDPDKYSYVQQAIKQMRGQMTINAITSGDWDYVTVATNWQSWIDNEIADFALSNGWMAASTADILKGINQTLSSNTSAASASETMDAIENDMYTLQNRLKNLKKEASQVFKWDVPQYIVNAYIANRTAEIQDQLSILENRYNAAYTRYQDQVKQAQWEMEYDLKQKELSLKAQSYALDDYVKRQWVAQDWRELSLKYNQDGVSYWLEWNKIPTSKLSREEITSAVDQLLEDLKAWKIGNAQCAAWIQKYYLPTLWVDFWTLSKYSEKQSICNEFAGSYTPQEWDIIVLESKSKPENWHMWIVTEVVGNNVKYMDWNGDVVDGSGTEEPWIHQKSLSDWTIYWYYNPTKTDYNPDSTWYISELWYNPIHADIYKEINSWKMNKSDMETQAKRMNITLQELWRRADNYAMAEDLWLIDGDTGEVEKWYDEAWTDTLRDIANWTIKLNSASAATYAQMMWTDVRWLWKMVEAYKNEQLAKWRAWWLEVLRAMAELQNNFVDAWWLVNGNFNTSILYWLGVWAVAQKHNQLKALLKLNKVKEARQNWATFGNMTEWEWKILDEAASALNMIFLSDEQYTNEFKSILNATWLATYWEPITDAKWKEFVAETKNSRSTQLEEISKSSNNWWGNFNNIGNNSWATTGTIDFWTVIMTGNAQ